MEAIPKLGKFYRISQTAEFCGTPHKTIFKYNNNIILMIIVVTMKTSIDSDKTHTETLMLTKGFVLF